MTYCFFQDSIFFIPKVFLSWPQKDSKVYYGLWPIVVKELCINLMESYHEPIQESRLPELCHPPTSQKQVAF